MIHAVINLISREIRLFENYGDAVRFLAGDSMWMYHGKVKLEIE